MAVWGLCNPTLCFLAILAVYSQSRFFLANETCAVVLCAPTTKADPTFAALRAANERALLVDVASLSTPAAWQPGACLARLA